MSIEHFNCSQLLDYRWGTACTTKTLGLIRPGFTPGLLGQVWFFILNLHVRAQALKIYAHRGLSGQSGSQARDT